MNKTVMILITIVVLLANVPWFFNKFQPTHILGFPPWAIYSLVWIILFAILVCIFIGIYWDKLRELPDDSDEPGEGT